MLWFGVNPALQRKTQQEWERSTRPTIIQINTIAKLLNGMGLTHKPFSFDEVKNIIGQTFVEQSFEAYLEYGRRINHQGQMVGSDRYALEMLLKSGVAMVDPSGGDNRTKPTLTHFGADAVTFAQDTHPASSLPRGNIPLFKVHTDKFKDKNGNPLLPEYIKPDKNGYVFCGGDVAASEEKGKAVIFVPIFKNEGPISHENNPNDLIIRRTDIETSVPIESKMEKFWASIDKYAVFTYQNGEYTPLLKPQESTNIYPESEYTPIDYNETLHLLGILQNLCTIISTQSSTGETETNIKTLTPAHLFSELKGLLVDNPKKALKLFKSFEGDKLLAELRKIKPITPYTNKAQTGWFATLTSERDFVNFYKIYPECREDVRSMKWLKSPASQQFPTQVDLFIILLSYTGAQRAKGNLHVYLPVRAEPVAPNLFEYRIGSATFNTYGTDLELLDKIGVPIDTKKKTFQEGKRGYYRPDKKFTELNPSEIPRVRGIKLHPTVEPADIREAFSGRVKGVPSEKKNPKIHDTLLKFTHTKIPKTYVRKGKTINAYYWSGWYSLAEWITPEEFKEDIRRIPQTKPRELLRYMDTLITLWGSLRSALILQLQNALNNEHFTRVDDYLTLWLHQRLSLIHI